MVDGQFLARLLDDDRVGPGDFFGKFVQIGHRALVHDHLGRIEDMRGLAVALVDVALNVLEGADQTIRHPVRTAAITPYRGEGKAVVTVGAGLVVEKPGGREDRHANAHAGAPRDARIALLHVRQVAGAVNVEQFPGKLPTSDIGAFLDGAIPRFNQTDARAPAFIVRANGGAQIAVLALVHRAVAHTDQQPQHIARGRGRLLDDCCVAGCREQLEGNVAVHPFHAENKPGIGQVEFLGAAVVQHVAPAFISPEHGFLAAVALPAFFDPAQPDLHRVGIGAADGVFRVVAVVHILHQFGLEAGRGSVMLLARQNLELDAVAALGAEKPVHAGGDHVEGQGFLPARPQERGVSRIPLLAVIEPLILLHLPALLVLGVEFGGIEGHEALPEVRRLRAVEGVGMLDHARLFVIDGGEAAFLAAVAVSALAGQVQPPVCGEHILAAVHDPSVPR